MMVSGRGSKTELTCIGQEPGDDGFGDLVVMEARHCWIVYCPCSELAVKMEKDRRGTYARVLRAGAVAFKSAAGEINVGRPVGRDVVKRNAKPITDTWRYRPSMICTGRAGLRSSICGDSVPACMVPQKKSEEGCFI